MRITKTRQTAVSPANPKQRKRMAYNITVMAYLVTNAQAAQMQARGRHLLQTASVQESEAKSASGQGAPVPPNAPKRGRGWSGLPGWGKALIIIAAVIVVIALLTTGCNKAIDGIAGAFSDSFVSGIDNTVTTDFGHDYIGVVDVVGTISEDSSDTYNHQYILNAIECDD